MERVEERERPSAAAASAGASLVVCGFGSIGRRHVENLRSLGFRDIVLYRTGAGTVPDDDASGLPVDRELEVAFRRRPRAVLVSNPTALHVPVALAAARSGAHLFIEKPLSHSFEGVAELAREVDERRLVALVGFQFRCHPVLRQIKRWLDSGAIGDVVSAHAHWGEHLGGWHPWEDYRASYSARRSLGGGAILTLSHPFDYLRWLLGEVTAVSAEAGLLGGLEIDVEDTAFVVLRFASGALGGVYLDYHQRPAAHRLWIQGREGRITWDQAEGVARRYDAVGACSAAIGPPKGFTRNSLFVEEMRRFLRCLDGQESPFCTLEDGRRALSIALAAAESIATGRRIDV